MALTKPMVSAGAAAAPAAPAPAVPRSVAAPAKAEEVPAELSAEELANLVQTASTITKALEDDTKARMKKAKRQAKEEAKHSEQVGEILAAEGGGVNGVGSVTCSAGEAGEAPDG